MNEVVVPVDLTEEEKAVLAILSLRQFYIIFPTLIISSICAITIGVPFVNGIADIIIRFLIWILVNTAAVCIASIKSSKYNLYLSELLMVKISYWRSQKIYRA